MAAKRAVLGTCRNERNRERDLCVRESVGLSNYISSREQADFDDDDYEMDLQIKS